MDFKERNFSKDACLCNIFTSRFFKIYRKIIQLKQILSTLKYFENSVSL